MLRTEPRGLVYFPNPIVTSGNPCLHHLIAAGGNGERLLAETRTVPLAGLRPPAPGTILNGELVRVVEARPPAQPPLRGDDLRCPPGTPGFAAVMAYFWLDTGLRYLRRLGFPGLLSGGLAADPLDRSVPGAAYSRRQRRIGFAPAQPGGRPALAEDAKVILHELGHAVLHDQVQGWGGHPETRAMGEGFCDALAAIYFAHVNGGFHREVVGDWIRPPHGIRRVDADARYPRDLTGQRHRDGRIWARALWDLYRLAGGDSPGTAARLLARDAALRLMVGSLRFLRRGARFRDGARALLQADRELCQGRYAAAIRAAVAARGIPPGEAGAP